MIIPDAVTDDDIATIARGYSAAQAAGGQVVVRCAAPLAAAIAGTPGRLLDPPRAPPKRLLVVCGSHTLTATRQLGRLAAGHRPVRTLATDGLLESNTTTEATGPSNPGGRSLPEHTTAISLLDRRLYHANVVITDGDPYRMREARTERNHPEQDLINPRVGAPLGHQQGSQPNH